MASLLQLTIIAILMFLQNFIHQIIFPPSPLPSSTQQKYGFVARLIHLTTPNSPFYNPHATYEDLTREAIRTSKKRSIYLHQVMKGKNIHETC